MLGGCVASQMSASTQRAFIMHLLSKTLAVI